MNKYERLNRSKRLTKTSSFQNKRSAFDGFARYKGAWRILSVTISQSLNQDQINQCVPVASATKPRLIRGEAGNQVCFISLKHSLNPAKKPSPSPTPTPLWNISLQIHNSPIPLWMLSKMKAVVCTGALSALLSLPLSSSLSLFLSLLILSGIERKKKVNTQAAPALFNHFTLPALISLQHAAVIVTDQNLSVFVLEAFLPLLP